MSLRPFLDANILFTAAYNPQGLARLLFELQEDKSFSLLTSGLAIEEAKINLEIKKPAALLDLTKLIAIIQVVHAPTNVPKVLDLPPKDHLIFAAAMVGKSSHLLTGDKKHFGRYFKRPHLTAGIMIQSVREFFVAHFALK